MPRIHLNSNLQTANPNEVLPLVQGLFNDLEDQLNESPDIFVLTDTNQSLPEGVRNGDIVFSLINGEIQAGVYNGVEPVYGSFGSFTGAITNAQHGDRAGGTLHAAVTTTENGFMLASDKVKLNQYKGDTSSAGAASLTEYPSNGDWGFHTDTVGGTYKLAKNLSGVIKTVALT